MTNRDRVREFIDRFPGRDDDEIAAALSINPRQAINQICRDLVSSGEVVRQTGQKGKIVNFPIQSAEVRKASVPVSAPHGRPDSSVATNEWFWEGKVSAAIANGLRGEHWEICSIADTESKERGVDVVARRDGQDLLVEVKGYPSATYRDPRRAGEQKRTIPRSQAQQWYSHALLKGMRLLNSHPQAKVALGFPDFPRYRTLYAETAASIRLLGIAVIFVSESNDLEFIDV